MRPIKHLTPRYIFNKISRLIDERINPDNPWLTPESVKILNSIIKNDDVGVEFGSGRSTKWFAKRMGYLTSIEDNQKWFSIVSDALKRENLIGSKVSYQLAKKKEAEEKWRQASSIHNKIEQGERCDACRYDVGIIRADG